MSKKLAIIGAGGHGKVVGEIALLNQYQTIDFFDDRVNEIKEYPFNIIHNVNFLNHHFNDYDDYFVAIGDNQIRNDKIEWLKKNNLNIINLLHPKSTISKFCSLQKGVCVMANAVINPGTLIKEGVIINTSASIDHDCVIEKFSHISPNCSVSGSVRIGQFTHLGSGTSVHPEILIGDHVRTGVGSKVFKNIPDNSTYTN